MKNNEEPQIEPSDDDLKRLVEERYEEITNLQRKKSAQLKETETIGQRKIEELIQLLPEETVTTLKKLDKIHKKETEEVKAKADKIRSEFSADEPSVETQSDLHPGLVNGQLIASNSLIWITPQHFSLFDPDIGLKNHGPYPGKINLSASASGSGSGLSGTGADSNTVYLNWFFKYTPPNHGVYHHFVGVPLHGFFILFANNGIIFTGKEAKARIDLTVNDNTLNVSVSQSTNVFDLGGFNINSNDRYDAWLTMNFSAFLVGGAKAEFIVSAVFDVYARGGGSHAELNFSDGDANYIGMPWMGVSN